MMKSIYFAISIVAILASCASSNTEVLEPRKLKGAIPVHAEDTADYDPTTGIGCLLEYEGDNRNSAHILCRSRNSGEYAWNAVLARSKSMCPSQKFKMLFKRPPSLPTTNGVYGAQMDIECVKP
ncbi:hypothetical protein A9Q99_10235 [Gammaproteobacteria bacterium 45_16_T64]|nr:hypothetical protein A9Q99_10235 [Gammaproteobacteria bacterium 45_16_T64]